MFGAGGEEPAPLGFGPIVWTRKSDSISTNHFLAPLEITFKRRFVLGLWTR